jgi:endoglucanase
MLIAATLLAMNMTAPLPPLRVVGKDLVDPSGKRVVLRGCNLGNWFAIEPWMLDMSNPGFPDQVTLEKLLSERFGADEKDRLMDTWRENWITERDFESIRQFRFNLVRLPLNYRQFEDDARPYQLRKDAWKWVDRAISMAEKHGIYVILDMHGVQGGQSVYDHTGQVNQNRLWTDPENPKRLAWLWSELAKRYRSRAAVVAYDVFNEPYGGTKPQIDQVFAQVFPEIRKHDPDKLVFAHGRYDGFEFYGDPKARGWKNVGFQMHYYPGLFGFGRPTVATHARHLESLNAVQETIDRLNVPFLIGEMNVVFDSPSLGPEMMRRTYDRHEKAGWMTTMWSYKVLYRTGKGHTGGSWGMVTNERPFGDLDFRTASKSEIESFFKSQSTAPYKIYDALKEKLAAETVKLPELPALPPMRTEAPQNELPGWNQVDIGGSKKGGLEKTGEEIALFGGGEDIWGENDQFRFLYQPIEGDFELSVELASMEDFEDYAKAGLMIRGSMDPNAPHVLLSSFSNGELQFATRQKSGEDTKALPTQTPGLPIQLRVIRHGSRVEASFRKADRDWTTLGSHETPHLPNQVYAGAVALSHDNRRLIRIVYRKFALSRKEHE